LRRRSRAYVQAKTHAEGGKSRDHVWHCVYQTRWDSNTLENDRGFQAAVLNCVLTADDRLELAELIEAWRKLDGPLRDAILAMIRAIRRAEYGGTTRRNKTGDTATATQPQTPK
jgi:hypothetical protein